MRIAVDAMGGDDAPRVPVEGAVMAARETEGLVVVLVGSQDKLGDEIKRLGAEGDRVQVVDAPDVIGMDEAPAQAVKRKRDSSIVRAMRLQREGEVGAVVSAGNTGAVVAASLLELGRLPGVSRPAIAVLVPNVGAGCILLDVGANTECKPRHLVEFAVMGEIYARLILGRTRPRVGLLNIGEESSKGNELSQETYRLLSEGDLHFVGNVEGQGIFQGAADVVVCDGFVGNVILKFTESVVGFLASVMREELERSLTARLGGTLLRPAFRQLRQRLDYAEYGGAPLLGVDGVCMIAHGGSSAKAIKNAVMAGARVLETGANRQIQEYLEDPAPANLMHELAVQRAFLQDFLDKISGPIKAKDANHVFDMTEAISRLVGRISGMLNQTAITQIEIQYLQAVLTDLMVKYIDDPAKRSQFLAELRTAFGADNRANRAKAITAPSEQPVE